MAEHETESVSDSRVFSRLRACKSYVDSMETNGLLTATPTMYHITAASSAANDGVLSFTLSVTTIQKQQNSLPHILTFISN